MENFKQAKALKGPVLLSKAWAPGLEWLVKNGLPFLNEAAAVRLINKANGHLMRFRFKKTCITVWQHLDLITNKTFLFRKIRQLWMVLSILMEPHEHDSHHTHKLKLMDTRPFFLLKWTLLVALSHDTVRDWLHWAHTKLSCESLHAKCFPLYTIPHPSETCLKHHIPFENGHKSMNT